MQTKKIGIENAAIFLSFCRHFCWINSFRNDDDYLSMISKIKTSEVFDEFISVCTHKVNGIVWIRLHSMLHSICPSGWICSLHWRTTEEGKNKQYASIEYSWKRKTMSCFIWKWGKRVIEKKGSDIFSFCYFFGFAFNTHLFLSHLKFRLECVPNCVCTVNFDETTMRSSLFTFKAWSTNKFP